MHTWEGSLNKPPDLKSDVHSLDMLIITQVNCVKINIIEGREIIMERAVMGPQISELRCILRDIAQESETQSTQTQPPFGYSKSRRD